MGAEIVDYTNQQENPLTLYDTVRTTIRSQLSQVDYELPEIALGHWRTTQLPSLLL